MPTKKEKINKKIQQAVSELDLQRDRLIWCAVLVKNNFVLPTMKQFQERGQMVINEENTDTEAISYRFVWDGEPVLEMSDNFHKDGYLTFNYRLGELTSPILNAQGEKTVRS